MNAGDRVTDGTRTGTLANQPVLNAFGKIQVAVRWDDGSYRAEFLSEVWPADLEATMGSVETADDFIMLCCFDRERAERPTLAERIEDEYPWRWEDAS